MNIKLPRNLSFKICSDKSLKKAMSLYLYLVTVNCNGAITMDTAQISHAAYWLKVTTRTIQNWIKLAEQNGLIIKEGRYVTPISFIKMKEVYDVLHTGFYTIKLGKVKIEYILDLKCMEEQHLRCKTAYELKAGSNNSLQELITRLKLTNSNSDLINCQRFDYCTGQNELKLTDAERLILYAANPDFETGIKRYHKIFGYKGTSGFCYKKRKLKEMGMIEVKKRKFTIPANSMPHMTTQLKRDTLLGHHKYFKQDGTLNLFLADKISFNDDNNWIDPKNNDHEKI